MNTTFFTQIEIIEGKTASATKSSLVNRYGLAQITIRPGLSLLLRQAKIVTRPSGRQSHLSRYLIGVCTQTGIIVEVFLNRIDGLKGKLFQAQTTIKQRLIRRLSRTLSTQQTLTSLF